MGIPKAIGFREACGPPFPPSGEVAGEFRLAGNHNLTAGFSFSYPYGQNQAGTTGCDTFSTVTFYLTHQTPYPYIQNI
jgi:hypothetical protein